MQKWKGCIVEESLDDNRVLNDIEVVKVRITPEEKRGERWHIYNSLLSKSDIDRIHPHIKQGWYMHFWKDGKMIVLFKEKRFLVDAKDKSTWNEAIAYGLSIKISKEQLNFEMEF
jgi:hypothetical protein